MQIPDLTQERIAEALVITRDSYAKYETGKATPPLDILLAISRYYHVSTDLLLTVELRKYKLQEILKLPDNRILLPIQTDSLGENKIEIVPYKAKMGYLKGFADPEYIENLQTMSIPFLRNGKFRAFPVEGDSMPPYRDGTYIIGQYVEQISDLKIDKTYLIITRTGSVFKRIQSLNKDSITVASDETFYEKYDLKYTDILEAWQYAGSYSSQELVAEDFQIEDLRTMMVKVMNEMKELRRFAKLS